LLIKRSTQLHVWLRSWLTWNGNKMMELHSLFPTNIGIFHLDGVLSMEEKQYIVDLPRKNNDYNQSSLDSYVLNSKRLQNLKKNLSNCLNEYFNMTFKPSTECSLKITQSWSNYCENGAGHHLHSHPNSIVSGVFYVQTNDQDKIIFHRPYNEHEVWIVKPSVLDSFTAPSWWLPARQYSLILFPSTLKHEVDISSRKDIRISLSFNSFFNGTIGSSTNLTELII
jgi:uncharacterized protein (TIGR02466 family)